MTGVNYFTLKLMLIFTLYIMSFSVLHSSDLENVRSSSSTWTVGHGSLQWSKLYATLQSNFN